MLIGSLPIVHSFFLVKRKENYYSKQTMTNPATMIIITSNQELIQQFSSREIKNTHIINVNSNNNNNDKCVTIIENNMTFLGELSGTVCIYNLFN